MTDLANQEVDSLRPFYIAVALVLGAVVITGCSLWFAFGDMEKQGQFGDMFGVLNAAFSGLAFSALVYTLVLQRKELRLQREELALTRGELQKQAAAQAEHAKTAFRAAKISALGSLYQSYATLVANHRDHYIGTNSVEELNRVREDLKQLLEHAA
jgi:hypothetical protein